MNFYQIKNQQLLLSVYLQPNAAKDEVVGLFNGALKIRIKAAPIDGKANEYLIQHLAKLLNIPKSQIALIKGETQRYKQLMINPIPQDYKTLLKLLLP